MMPTSELKAMWVEVIQKAQRRLLDTNIPNSEYVDLSIKLAQELRAAWVFDAAFLGVDRKEASEKGLDLTPRSERAIQWLRGRPQSTEPQAVEQWLLRAPPCFAGIEVEGVGRFISTNSGVSWRQHGSTGAVKAEVVAHWDRRIHPEV
jgi:hypothetical protein